jgi:hypothetical protein
MSAYLNATALAPEKTILRSVNMTDPVSTTVQTSSPSRRRVSSSSTPSTIWSPTSPFWRFMGRLIGWSPATHFPWRCARIVSVAETRRSESASATRASMPAASDL